MSASPVQPDPMESACPSETEEAISDEDEVSFSAICLHFLLCVSYLFLLMSAVCFDLQDEEQDKLEDEGDHCTCPKSLIALPPLRLSEVDNSSTAPSTGSCWKCAGPSTSR